MLINTEERNTEPAPQFEEGNADEWELALEAADALGHGRLEKGAGALASLPAMRSLIPLLNELDALDRETLSRDNVTRIADSLSAAPALQWSLGSEPSERHKSLTRFTALPTLKEIEETPQGLHIHVSEGERTQLRYDFEDGPQDTVFAHYLIKTTFQGVTEAFAAIRWLHNKEREEVVLRFRPMAVVAGQSIEVPLSSDITYNYISIGRLDNQDVVLVNGLPVYWRPASTQAPTGVTLDFIGTPVAPSSALIPLFMVQLDSVPKFLRDTDIPRWFELLLYGFARKGNLTSLSHCLHASAGILPVLSEHTYGEALKANLAQQQGYRDFLTDQLIERLPSEAQEKALADLANKEPATIIRVENATVKIPSNPSLHASLGRLFGRSSPKVTLLDGVSFRAYAGDIVGIIGKNGAGKTTFLKTLVSAMPLEKGRISVDGRPILLRPGAGMQGDLTGRENVLKTGLYMGFLPGELRGLMDEIIEFAELEGHMDRPFRYYSDGMRARLIFALATAIPRDILLFDELLSAGDIGFQRKAMKRLDKFIERAKLVFVVQHTFDFILSRCSKCLLLDKGRPVYFGDPAIATELYKESL